MERLALRQPYQMDNRLSFQWQEDHYSDCLSVKCLYIESGPQLFGANWWQQKPLPGLILGLRPANERRCYNVTPSLIGWAQT